ncbi:oligosaccharide flippase family protein [Alteromonas sp. A081]|uniref:oligosaccharide flippase family protein n=1 Tax=Alteromonas sp. A081 TaxID=3410269 RepID=UPI003B97F65E
MDLKLKVLKGSFLSLTIQWISRTIGVVSTLILVRLLSPEDFGIAALSTLVMMFFLSLSQFGVSQYIIKTKNISTQQVNSAWSIQLILNVFVSIIVFLLSTHISLYLDSDKLIDVLKITCLMPILSGLVNPEIYIAQKNLEFGKISLIEVISKIISTPITVSLAFIGLSYWALVYGTLIHALLKLLSSYVLFSEKPKISFRYSTEIFSTSKWMLVNSITSFARVNVEKIIINQKFGAKGVGLYDTSKEVGHIPLTDIILPASNPILAGVSQASDDLQERWAALMKYHYVSIFFILPCIFGIFLLSDVFVKCVLGDSWLEVIPIVGPMSVLMVVYLIYNICRMLMIFSNDMKILSISDIISIIVMVMILTTPIFSSLEFLIIGRVGIGLIFCVLLLIIIMVKNNCELRSILQLYIIVSILCVPLVLVVFFTREYIAFPNDYIELFLCVFIGSITYIATYLIASKWISKINLYFNFFDSLIALLFQNLKNKF